MVSQTTFTSHDLHRFFDRCTATPTLLVDLAVVEQDFLTFRASFPDSPIFYAIKANPHPDVLTRLSTLGAGFEVSSVGELRLLLGLGIEGGRIISSNPVKTPAFLREAHAAGVRYFAYDSVAEVDKLAELAPGSQGLVRLEVSNEHSEWPLDKKFGVDSNHALELLAYARDRGVDPVGVIFHVGSQCRSVDGWRAALEKTSRMWDEGRQRGAPLEILNVGGGMPVVYTDDRVPSIAAVARAIRAECAKLFPSDSKVWLEPGRAIVGRAGTLVCSVIGLAQRGGARWVYLDVGVFHGLAEATGGIRYRFLSDAPGPESPCTIAGPSCDSVDVISTDALLPDVRVGDRLAIASCGAYTTVYASGFNGFPGPETQIIESWGDG
ncbi:MAG: type III PLP-dependent enzyme [Chloroflexi bacterium]|nr:type III PLP-dependent enzyme [Chloroflexota bacterium]